MIVTIFDMQASLSWADIDRHFTNAELNQAFNYPEMQDHLKRVYNLQTLPQFPGITSDEICSDYRNGAINEEFRAVFDEVRLYFFKNPIIQLQRFGCENLIAEYSVSRIFIDIDYVKHLLSAFHKEEKKSVLRYVFAHEVAHFVVQASFSLVDFHIDSSTSLNGNFSIYRNKVPQNDSEVRKNSLEKFKSHAEVDAYTALVLKKNGFEGWDVVYKMMSQMAKEEREEDPNVTPSDVENRMTTIKDVLRDQPFY